MGSQSEQRLRDPALEQCGSMGASGVRLAGTTSPTSGRLPGKSSECLCLDAWFWDVLGRYLY